MEKHGMKGTRLYTIWKGMRYRCLNPNNCNYHKYGGKGITVCEEWKSSFLSFYNWSIKNGYSDTLSIDRIDNNGNYEPSNCKWSNHSEQQINRSIATSFTHNGKTQTLAEWCVELDLNYKTIWNRINTIGVSFEQAISVPKGKRLV